MKGDSDAIPGVKIDIRVTPLDKAEAMREMEGGMGWAVDANATSGTVYALVGPSRKRRRVPATGPETANLYATMSGCVRMAQEKASGCALRCSRGTRYPLVMVSKTRHVCVDAHNGENVRIQVGRVDEAVYVAMCAEFERAQRSL